jgi:hypothetical protein
MTITQPESIQTSIDAFKERVQCLVGYKIHEAVIWKFAHYKGDTQWKRWKSGRLASDSSAASTFRNILQMPPEEFIETIKKQSSKTSVAKFF